MDLNELLSALSEPSRRNGALRFLESIVVDTNEDLLQQLSATIAEPTVIEDTNRFASLLVDLGAEAFIPPLIKAISCANAHTAWLSDYMYALVRLLMDREECFPTDEPFVHLMGGWLLSTGGGEISDSAGGVLAELDHPATREYLVSGAADSGLFHQTRIACIGGIVNHYPDEAMAVLAALANDPDEHVREAVADAQAWLDQRSV
jgi:hypothetical protein